MATPEFQALELNVPSRYLKSKVIIGIPWWRRLQQRISLKRLLWRMQGSPKSSNVQTTTSLTMNRYSIPPMPITELTMEQSFKLRRLEDLLPEADKADIITVLLALQRQNFVLGNNLTQLLKAWTTTDEDQSKSGTSSETKT